MFFMLGSGVLIAALVVGLAPWIGSPWNFVVAGVLGVAAAYLLGMGCFMLYGSKVGKLKRRERLLNLVPWSGAETVLDVGCGRGLMMIAAAKRLTSGKAVGIDLWQAEDQSGNNSEATIQNARLEGVGERVEVQTSDMRTLTFKDETFDVIVSHWAVHNLYDPKDRKTALKEMVRVLKSGGYILLADIEHHDEYAGVLKEFGLKDVKVIENGMPTRIAAAVSFGSYRPATVYARK
jgi:ubiquinone/menaquinone biosynthesis C-methylase UbiE